MHAYIYELTEYLEVTLNIQYVAIILNIHHVRVTWTSVDWSLMTRICTSELGHRWFRWWLGTSLVPSHCLNQWWIIHTGISSDKLNWNWKKIGLFPFRKVYAFQSYLRFSRSISWLLMPWLLTSSGHQQPWYWLGRFLPYLRKDFNYLRRTNVEKWHKM